MTPPVDPALKLRPRDANPGPVPLTMVHARLWRHLEAMAPGRARARTRLEICASLTDVSTEVGREFAEMPERAFKRVTKQLLDAGYPALSSAKGYYAGQDAADLAAFEAYIDEKAKPTLHNKTLAKLALEAQRCREAGDPDAFQALMPTPEAPRRLAPVGPVAQPESGQQVLV